MKNLIVSVTYLVSFLVTNAQSGYSNQLSADNNMLTKKKEIANLFSRTF